MGRRGSASCGLARISAATPQGWSFTGKPMALALLALPLRSKRLRLAVKRLARLRRDDSVLTTDNYASTRASNSTICVEVVPLP